MSTDLIELAEQCGFVWTAGSLCPDHWVANRSAINAFASALSTQEGKPSIPHGWKLVPVEPTPDMMCAAWDHTPPNMDDITDGDFGQAYKDMLAAAPTPTQARASAPETPTMGDGWCVTVERWGDKVLSISDQHYSGREPDEADEALIIGAAQHLLSFVGYGLPPSRFDPDEARASDAEDAGDLLSEVSSVLEWASVHMVDNGSPTYQPTMRRLMALVNRIAAVDREGGKKL